MIEDQQIQDDFQFMRNRAYQNSFKQIDQNEFIQLYSNPRHVSEPGPSKMTKSSSLKNSDNLNCNDDLETSSKYCENSETNSPAHSVRSSKSNHSGVLKAKQQINSIEEDIKNANTLYDKKCVSYRIVKNWEDKRIQNTSIFNNIFSNISENLIKIAEQSNEFIDCILNFMRDNQKYLGQFAKNSNSQQTSTLTQLPQINKDTYPIIYDILKEQSLTDIACAQNFQDLSMFIEQNIIKPFLIDDKKNFEQKFYAFSTFIKDRKIKIQKLDKVTVNAYDEYTNLFKDIVSLQQKGKEGKKDFYYSEILFIHYAQEHFESLREFGINVVNFIEELEQLQKIRNKNILSALTVFINKRQELTQGYQKGDLQKIILKFQNEIELNLVDIESTLQPQYANYIKKHYCQNEINIQILKLFSNDFSLERISNQILIQMEFKAQLLEKQDSPKSEQKECQIIHTVDNYLIIKSIMTESQSKPFSLIYLPICKTTLQKQQLLFTIVEKQKKLLWKSKKTYFFQIENSFDTNSIISLLYKNSFAFNQ